MAIRQTTVTVVAVKIKWIEAEENGHTVLVRINAESADWRPGGTYTFWAVARTESGQVWRKDDYRCKTWYHCLLIPFDYDQGPPLTDDERRVEIDRWLHYIEAAATEGRIYKRGIDKVQWLGIDKSPTRRRRLKTILKAVVIDKAKNEAEQSLDRLAQEPPDFAAIEIRYLSLIETLTQAGRANGWAGSSLVKRLDRRYPDIKATYGRQLSIFDFIGGGAA